MNELLFIEKAILESLLRGEKDIFQLSLDLNVALIVLSKIIFNMIKKNLITFRNQHYLINKEIFSNRMHKIGEEGKLTWDSREIIEGMLDNAVAEKASNKGYFKMRKIFLSEKDLPFFRAQIANLERFLSSLPSQPAENRRIHEKSVFCWGLTDYNSILSSQIN